MFFYKTAPKCFYTFYGFIPVKIKLFIGRL